MTPELKAAVNSALALKEAIDKGYAKCVQTADFDRVALVDALQVALSQAEANRVDAERYRWLRGFASPRQKPAPEDMPLSYYPVLLRCDTAVYSPATWGNDVDRLVDTARLTNAVKTKG